MKVLFTLLFSLGVSVSLYSSPQVSIIAHRGNSAEAPENTLAAFQQALDLKVDFLEMDIHMTEDGELIVIHDSSLGRTTSDPTNRKVAELSLREIQQLDAGSWFSSSYKNQRVPTLKEVFQLSLRTAGLMLELKSPPDKEQFAHQIALFFRNQTSPPPFYLASLDLSLLRRIQKLDPTLPLMPVVEFAKDLPKAWSLQPSVIACYWELITPQFVKEVHEKKILLWTWTVDDPSLIRELTQWGVDGVITNTPRTATKHLCYGN